MGAKEDIKSILAKENLTMTEVVNRLNNKYSRNDKLQNLSNKLRRGTLKYNEAVEIAEVIGYKIKWVKENGSF